jgi:hypothetical protein
MDNFDRNVVQLSLEVFKNQFLPFVQNELIMFYGIDWELKLRNDPNIDRTLIEELYNEKLFYKNSDIRNLLLVFSHQWDRIFKKNYNTDYPCHLCEVIIYHYNQWVYEYKFNFRDTYKIIELIQSFMEELNFNIYEINLIRLDMLLYLATETFNLANISQDVRNQINNPNSNTIQIFKMYFKT